MSAFSALEAAVVIEARNGESGGRELDLLLHRIQVDIVPLNTDQMALARSTWRRFGKGRHAATVSTWETVAPMR